MFEEEEKKQLEWYNSGGSDFETKNRSGKEEYLISETVFAQWSNEHDAYTGLIRFGIITEEGEDAIETFTVLHGFDENGMEYWQEWETEHFDFSFWPISTLMSHLDF